jgi:hypothetical protein
MIPTRVRSTSKLAAVLLGLFTSFGLSGCDNPSRSEVEPLVARHATREEVASALGWSAYTWYSPGSGDLTAFLGREPAEQYQPVRAAVQAGRGIMFNTTAWQQSWLFFDSSDRLMGYWFNTQ